MQHRTILITGTSRGIGRQLAEHYACENTVIGISRMGEGPADDHMTHVACDLSNVAALVTCADDLFRKTPGIDVLINNASVLTSKPLVLMNDADILQMVQTNLVATILLTKRALRLMMRRRGGRIINIVSMAPRLSKPGDSVYAATKAAVEAFAKVANVEAHAYGISVNNVAISAMPTKMMTEASKNNPEALQALIPHGAFAKLESIVSSIDFLCSGSSGDIGGQTIYLGGI